MISWRYYLFLVTSVGITASNSGDDASRHLTYRLPSHDAHWWVADLTPAVTFTSRHDRNGYNVSLAIPYTFNRLGVLKLQCETWKGPIAAAVYVPLRQGGLYAPNKPQNGWAPQLVLNWLAGVYNNTERGCVLDMAVYTEELLEDPQSNEFWRVPVNAIRNLAMAMVKTPVVGIVDADFVVGPASFVNSLRDATQYEKLRVLLQDNHGLYVLPALEHNGSALSLAEGLKIIKSSALAANKTLVLQHLHQRLLHPFHHQYHLFTDYDRWAAAAEQYEICFPAVPSSDDITSHRGHLYEPYVLAWRAHLPEPLFDERFRGYHLNKAQGLAYISHQGSFRWYVHPEGFVLHCPHAVAKEDRRKDIHSTKSKLLETIWDAELISDAQGLRPFKPIVSHGTAHMYNLMQTNAILQSSR